MSCVATSSASRLPVVDLANDLKHFADEIKRHFDVTAEFLRSEIHHIAEGLINVAERNGDSQTRSVDGEVKAMI